MSPELKLISSTAMYSILQELLPQFQIMTGTSPSVKFNSSNLIMEGIYSGESADAIILTKLAVDKLVKDGKVFRYSCVNLAKTGIGIVVRSGTARPDISTVQAFKNTLMQVNSITYTSTGTSGVYFSKLIENLGLSQQLKAKSITPKGGHVAKIVASGDAALGVQLTSELLSTPGVEYVGDLPMPLQMDTIFVAGIFTSSKNVSDAINFVDFLSQPKFSPLYQKYGMKLIGKS